MIVHLVDGTYELFRHFYGIRRFKKTDPPYGAVSGVLTTVAQLLDEGGTHVGVATDHIIESYRNKLSTAYKNCVGIKSCRAREVPVTRIIIGAGQHDRVADDRSRGRRRPRFRCLSRVAG